MNLVERVKNLILTPKAEWQVIDNETPDTKAILVSYCLPLILLAAVATFVGYSFIGYKVFTVNISGGTWGLYHAIHSATMGIASIFITTAVVDALAPFFGAEKNYGKSFQLVAYGATPSLLAGVLTILPWLGSIASIVSIFYSLYLWYIGISLLKKTPEDKKIVYLIVIFIVLAILYSILGALLSRLLMPAFGLYTPY